MIAGTVHQGPGGHPAGTHEYEKSVRLLAHWLRAASHDVPMSVETHFMGWPEDSATLDDADVFVLVSDGADRNEADHPFLIDDRLDVVERQMQRGCGLVVIHWSLFVPNEPAGAKFIKWIGGYFDYQSGTGPRSWYSKIQTAEAPCRSASPDHPVARGLKPFDLREEFYYNMRMRPGQPGLVPILSTSLPGETDSQIVAWALERPTGGRGFGFTGGHFFDNWQLPEFRGMVLNAIVWCAGGAVPDQGIQSEWPAESELTAIADDPPSER